MRRAFLILAGGAVLAGLALAGPARARHRGVPLPYPEILHPDEDHCAEVAKMNQLTVGPLS